MRTRGEEIKGFSLKKNEEELLSVVKVQRQRSGSSNET
jgi:hypothetical protein